MHDDPAATPAVLVSYIAAAGAGPVRVDAEVVLEPRSPVVWFTFPGIHHDIGRFHTPAGAFTGYYANILTPVEVVPGHTRGPDIWRTTDLFLDVFMSAAGDVQVLDRDELEEAVTREWLDPGLARAAEAEAERLVRLARAGRWPPPVVDEWPLERARSVADSRPDD